MFRKIIIAAGLALGLATAAQAAPAPMNPTAGASDGLVTAVQYGYGHRRHWHGPRHHHHWHGRRHHGWHHHHRGPRWHHHHRRGWHGHHHRRHFGW